MDSAPWRAQQRGQAELLLLRAVVKVQLHVRSLLDRPRLSIRVLDRGPGVAPAELDTIFHPFFRSSNASTEGHGLGLAIAQHVIEAHGGTIRASNREGGGLSVEIILPVKPY